jgi:uncharacterized repeat protein (TIGR03803 family)
MKGKCLVALLFALLAVSAAYASGPQPVVAFTFECKTSGFQGQGPCPNGGRPDSLTQGSDGNFYGAAQDSMEGSSTPTGGTVFSVTPAGKFTLLHTFAPGPNKNYPNGNLPSLLIEGSDGKLYGTTLFGGVGGCNGYCGSGVLYRVSKNGTGFQVIHKFCSASNCSDGGFGILVAGTDGNIYGSSFSGGTGNCGGFYQGCGTIFRVTPSSGTYQVVVNFDISTIGAFPSGLTLAADGTFYGFDSGSSSESLFHYTPASGAFTTVAVKFPAGPNGLPSHPASTPAFGANGNIYGLYVIYGTSGEGLFELHVDGSNLQLFPFYTTVAGGGSPDGLLLATDGNFWVAEFNGKSGYGDIITLSPADGTLLQRLTPFSAPGAAGAYPAEIIQAKDGKLWGSTYQGGKAPQGFFSDGTVFSLNVGLPPR